MEQKKILDISTKFRWKITEGDKCFVGVCDRLKLTIQADSIEELTDMAANAASMLFLDLYMDNEFNQYTYDHSVEYKFTDVVDYIAVAPTPIIVS